MMKARDPVTNQKTTMSTSRERLLSLIPWFIDRASRQPCLSEIALDLGLLIAEGQDAEEIKFYVRFHYGPDLDRRSWEKLTLELNEQARKLAVRADMWMARMPERGRLVFSADSQLETDHPFDDPEISHRIPFRNIAGTDVCVLLWPEVKIFGPLPADVMETLKSLGGVRFAMKVELVETATLLAELAIRRFHRSPEFRQLDDESFEHMAACVVAAVEVLLIRQRVPGEYRQQVLNRLMKFAAGQKRYSGESE